MRTLLLRTLGVAAGLASFSPAAVRAQVPFTPYGMDGVPGAVFYTEPWNHYGSDPVPASVTSNLGLRDFYGLDAIPETALPHLHRLKDTLPGETLQVLTRAIEGSSRQSRAGKKD